MTTARLRRLLASLRADHPTDKPVRVVRKVLRLEQWAHTECTAKRYTITIKKTLPSPMQEIILLHEYAHCMTWLAQEIGGLPTIAHDTVWGAAYARVWRMYCKEYIDEDCLGT
jgi:hypothetical protein